MKHVHRRTVANWLLVLFYCLFIFFLSSTTSPGMLPKIDHVDKVIHFGAFVVMGILFFRAYRSPGFSLKISYVIAATLVSSTIFGLLIEIRQYYLPYRSAEAMDVVADVAGCVIGICFYMMVLRKKWLADS